LDEINPLGGWINPQFIKLIAGMMEKIDIHPYNKHGLGSFPSDCLDHSWRVVGAKPKKATHPER
jgi:hypothetical protein